MNSRHFCDYCLLLNEQAEVWSKQRKAKTENRAATA
jgi:hypothetical protein